jgi:hypothetical protein
MIVEVAPRRVTAAGEVTAGIAEARHRARRRQRAIAAVVAVAVVVALRVEQRLVACGQHEHECDAT